MYKPVIPMSGLGGWVFLQNTLAAQTDAFEKSPEIERKAAKALSEFQNVTSVDDLMENRRALELTLGAFGLSKDISKTYFVQKMALSDPSDDQSLINRLSDARYKNLNSAVANLRTGQILDEQTKTGLVAKFKAHAFEEAVGEQDNSMRMALYTQRTLGDLASNDTSENTKWYMIMGTPALREVFQTFLRLPSSFANLDLDRQLDTFKTKLAARTGQSNIAQFAETENLSKLIQGYLLQDQIKQGSTQTNSHSVALSLLQNSGTI